MYLLEQLLQKLGTQEKTVDKNFEELKHKWKELCKLVIAIDNDIKKQKKIEGI